MRLRNRERGSVLLETGLALPVLVMLLLGGVDFGRLVQLRQSVVGAARAGAQAVWTSPTGEDAGIIAAANAFDDSGPKTVTLERFERGQRHYLRIRVQAPSGGLFGLAGQTVEASATVRLK